MKKKDYASAKLLNMYIIENNLFIKKSFFNKTLYA